MAQIYFIPFILYLCFAAGQDPQYVLKGTKAKLLPSKTVSQPQEFLWKHNGDKVIEFDGHEEVVFGQYENRVTLVWESAELTITDVRHEDSGQYELDVFIEGKLHRSQLELKVLDKVVKPIINCKMMDESVHNTSGQHAKLMCSSASEQSQDVKFLWHSNGKKQPGHELTISVGDKYDDDEHTCAVSNVIHTETTTFTTKECYPAKSSTLTIGLAVGFVLVFLLAVLGFCFCKRLQVCLGRGRSDDVEKQDKVLNETATHEEQRPLVDRQSTLPSKQPLRNFPQSHQNDSNLDNHEAPVSSPLPPQDLNDNKDKDPQFKNSEPENPKESEPATDDPVESSENVQSELQSPASSEQPGFDTPAAPHYHALNAGELPQVESLAHNIEESEPADDPVESSENVQSELQSPARSEQPEICRLDDVRGRKLVQKNRSLFDTSPQNTPSRRATQRGFDTENGSSPAAPTNQSPHHHDLNVDEDKVPQVESLAHNIEESEPADDPVESSEDEQSDLQSRAASEPPENDNEKDEESMSPPALLTNQSPHTDLNDKDKYDNSERTAKESDLDRGAMQLSEDKDPQVENSDPGNLKKSEPAYDAEPSSEHKRPDLQSPAPSEQQAPVSSPLPPQDLNDNKDKDPQFKNSEPENPKESEPADDPVESSENVQSELQSPASSEEPEICRLDDVRERKLVQRNRSLFETSPQNTPSRRATWRGSQKEGDESEERTSLLPSAVSSHTASPDSPLSQNAQIKETKDTDDEHKNDSSSDEVTEQIEYKNIRESDSSGAGEIDEAEEPSERKKSTVTERRGSEILSQKDEKSVAENEYGGESEIAEVTNLSLDTTRSGLDQESNKVCQESKGQSDNDAEKDDENNHGKEEHVECSSANKEPGNDHLSENEKEQKADVVS